MAASVSERGTAGRSWVQHRGAEVTIENPKGLAINAEQVAALYTTACLDEP